MNINEENKGGFNRKENIFFNKKFKKDWILREKWLVKREKIFEILKMIKCLNQLLNVYKNYLNIEIVQIEWINIKFRYQSFH